jgi:hypothetical protein
MVNRQKLPVALVDNAWSRAIKHAVHEIFFILGWSAGKTMVLPLAVH